MSDAPQEAAPTVIGFVCDWAVATEGLTDGEGRLRVHPSVKIVRVPCSGFMRPNWLEETLRAGVDGTFVTGCPYGDCLNREGNYLMRERVEQLERRLQRRRIDPQRVAMLAHGLHDHQAFLSDVAAFVQRLSGLPRTSAQAAAPRTPARGAPRPEQEAAVEGTGE